VHQVVGKKEEQYLAVLGLVAVVVVQEYYLEVVVVHKLDKKEVAFLSAVHQEKT
jgi:hypothetical protein